jgi:hypothetical protein
MHLQLPLTVTNEPLTRQPKRRAKEPRLNPVTESLADTGWRLLKQKDVRTQVDIPVKEQSGGVPQKIRSQAFTV